MKYIHISHQKDKENIEVLLLSVILNTKKKKANHYIFVYGTRGTRMLRLKKISPKPKLLLDININIVLKLSESGGTNISPDFPEGKESERLGCKLLESPWCSGVTHTLITYWFCSSFYLISYYYKTSFLLNRWRKIFLTLCQWALTDRYVSPGL